MECPYNTTLSLTISQTLQHSYNNHQASKLCKLLSASPWPSKILFIQYVTFFSFSNESCQLYTHALPIPYKERTIIQCNTNIEYLQYKLLKNAYPPKVNFQQDLSHINAYTWVVSASCWSEYTTTDIFIIRFYHIWISNKFIFRLLTNTNIG